MFTCENTKKIPRHLITCFCCITSGRMISCPRATYRVSAIYIPSNIPYLFQSNGQAGRIYSQNDVTDNNSNLDTLRIGKNVPKPSYNNLNGLDCMHKSADTEDEPSLLCTSSCKTQLWLGAKKPPQLNELSQCLRLHNIRN